MKKALQIISIIFFGISMLIFVIFGSIKLFRKLKPETVKTIYVPSAQSLYQQCREENKEKILEAYQKCVADAHGNNVRCEESAKRIFCGYF